MEDVYILELNEKKIVVFSVVSEEMIRLWEYFFLYFCVLILSNILEDLKIVYYNCRFFYFYIKDLIIEKNMFDSDIVVVVESRFV